MFQCAACGVMFSEGYQLTDSEEYLCNKCHTKRENAIRLLKLQFSLLELQAELLKTKMRLKGIKVPEQLVSAG